MGSICSCLSADNFEEDEHLTQQFANVCTGLPQSCRVDVIQSSDSGSSLAGDNSITGASRSPPRPLTLGDPRNCWLHVRRDGSLAICYSASGQSQEEPEPLIRSGSNDDNKPKGITEERNNGAGSESCQPESSLNPSQEESSGAVEIFSSSEDEDVCSICLEEYTDENPRIALQCCHDYHLSCIYEWYERSASCPVCGKVMLFTEST